MYTITALHEKLEKLNLLNHPYPFPCIIIILTSMQYCLFWKQELTSAPSQETTWDFVAVFAMKLWAGLVGWYPIGTTAGLDARG